MSFPIAVLLHNIRSTHNVGSIFRTAEAAGVEKIYLSGYTPAPADRFGRARKDIAKTALGAEKMIPWEEIVSLPKTIKKLKLDKWEIVGVEQDRKAIDYRKFSAGLPAEASAQAGGGLNRPTLFIFGNEVKGISKPIRNACDKLIEIPMRGLMVRQAHHSRHTKRGKESLNVSVAAGIVLFQMIRNPKP